MRPENEKPAIVPSEFAFQTASALLEKLHPLCERRDEFVRMMIAAGFTAFLPRYNYEASYCQDEDEIDFLRKCQIEECKEKLSRSAWGLPGTPAIEGDYIQPTSMFLDELRHKRDVENGCRYEEINSCYSAEESYWRKTFTPIQRRIAQTNSEIVKGLWDLMIEEQSNSFAEDLNSQLNDNDFSLGWTRSQLSRQFLATAGNKLEQLGFEHVKKKSPRNFPNLTRSLNANWDLQYGPRWTKYWDISTYPGKETDQRTWARHLDPRLVLCHGLLEEQVTDVYVGRTDVLEVQFLEVLPELHAYNFFWGPRELELVVRANTTFLTFVLPDIIAVLESDELLN